MSATPSATAMRAAEQLDAEWRLNRDGPWEKRTREAARVIDNEFKELREAAEEVTEAIDSGREVSLFAFARLRSALTHTTKGTHDKAE